MTPALWKIVVASIHSIEDAPQWLVRQAGLNFESATNLPVLDKTVDGEDALPRVEEKLVKLDYLDFLREQIQLGARGQEWVDILKARLSALSPFLEKKLITATFHCKPHYAALRIDPEAQEIIYLEME